MSQFEVAVISRRGRTVSASGTLEHSRRSISNFRAALLLAEAATPFLCTVCTRDFGARRGKCGKSHVSPNR
jgi:hypothetical protein